jgi:cytochrome c biogenesis protein CcmG, thiol:disulfide interchange protein DsbE
MKKKNSSKKTLVISGIILAFFMSLMIYALKQDPNFNPSQLVGERAPPISAYIAQGGSFNSSDTFNKGRWVIINFWSSFCFVCRSEAPEIENFYQTVSLQNINNPNFISINIQDDKEIIAQWQSNYKQTFPVIQDIKGLISVRYGVTGTPETFFIDPNSIVRYRVAGALNKRIILNFISWLDKNPNASQDEATKALMNMRSNS